MSNCRSTLRLSRSVCHRGARMRGRPRRRYRRQPKSHPAYVSQKNSLNRGQFSAFGISSYGFAGAHRAGYMQIDNLILEIDANLIGFLEPQFSGSRLDSAGIDCFGSRSCAARYLPTACNSNWEKRPEKPHAVASPTHRLAECSQERRQRIKGWHCCCILLRQHSRNKSLVAAISKFRESHVENPRRCPGRQRNDFRELQQPALLATADHGAMHDDLVKQLRCTQCEAEWRDRRAPYFPVVPDYARDIKQRDAAQFSKGGMK